MRKEARKKDQHVSFSVAPSEGAEESDQIADYQIAAAELREWTKNRACGEQHFGPVMALLLRNNEAQRSRIRKQPLSFHPHYGFTLHDIFSPEECDALVQAAEKVGFGSSNTAIGYRKNERLVLDYPSFVEVIWQRTSQFLPAQTTRFLPPAPGVDSGADWDIGKEGDELNFGKSWAIRGLGRSLRFDKYTAGEGFGIHRDSNVIRGEECSLYTFIIYLNDGFEGGGTHFVKERKKGTAEPDNIAEALVPKQGMGVVFRHELLHEGAPLVEGSKFITRTDVYYAVES